MREGSKKEPPVYVCVRLIPSRVHRRGTVPERQGCWAHISFVYPSSATQALTLDSCCRVAGGVRPVVLLMFLMLVIAWLLLLWEVAGSWVLLALTWLVWLFSVLRVVFLASAVLGLRGLDACVLLVKGTLEGNSVEV